MPSPKGDPTYIKNKDRYFMDVASAIARASTHPKAPGGCVIVRDREIIGDGRSLYTDSKVEVDCISYAIASAAKNGTATIGAVIYSTRYPFATSVFQAHVMGIRKMYMLAHEWEPYYSDEFKRAARLARELKIALVPLYMDEDPRFATNTNDLNNSVLNGKENPYEPDEYDPNDAATSLDDDTISL